MATAAGREEKLDLGRVVQRGIEVLQGGIVPYGGLSLLLIGLPTAAFYWLLLRSGQAGAAGFLDVSSSLSILSWVARSLGGSVLQAAIVRSSLLQLSGRPPEPARSLAIGLRLLLPMIGLTILTWTATWLGMILLIVPGVIVYVMLLVSVPVLVHERGGVFHSLRRSRELTKGSRGRIFLLLLLFLVVYLITSSVAAAIVAVAGSENVVVTSVLEGISGAAVSLTAAVMLAALYHELRGVKEGAAADGLVEIFA